VELTLGIQFHWQDYSDKRYLQALQILASFRSTDAYCTPLKADTSVKIGGIGLVNFDSARVEEICCSLGKGVILTNQVQVGSSIFRDSYSLTDDDVVLPD